MAQPFNDSIMNEAWTSHILVPTNNIEKFVINKTVIIGKKEKTCHDILFI